MRKTRRSALALTMILAGSAVVDPAPPALAAAIRSLDCRAAGSEDRTRGYDPSLRDAALSAYRTLFPHASVPPSDAELSEGTRFRCMDGTLLVCFVGANLPCDRMNAVRDNVGAAAFCREHPQAGDVPLVATGHDALFTYRCTRGRAAVSGQAYHLDGHGYARELWAAADTPGASGPAPSQSQVPSSAATPAADPIEERSKACLASAAGQTTSGMTACSHEVYVAYDHELNAVYQAVLKHVDPKSAGLIREAQRRWVAAQEADQAADDGPWQSERGSMVSPDLEALRIDAIRQRITKLRYYDPAP